MTRLSHSFLRVAGLLVLATLIGLLATDPATAQSRSDRYLIQVSPDDNTCRYQIQGRAEQDVFAIRPGGLVVVQAQGGVWVDVTVEDDARGVPGTRNQRALALRDRAPRDTLIARSAVGRSTEHRVRIQCCLNRGRNDACPKWTDAQPPSTTTGSWREAPMLLPGSQSIGRGPAESLIPAFSPLPPGGPVMRVEE